MKDRTRRFVEIALVGALALIFCTVALRAQNFTHSKAADKQRAAKGEQIFKKACVSCHGAGATGEPKAVAGFEKPRTFPDFTRCDQTTAEPDSTWKDIITYGGPARGFNQIMPSFGQALSSDEIDDIVYYLRTFCTNPHWARGELNLPRAFATEKAYPENEVVVTSAINAHGAPGFTTDIIHEERFGTKNQIEVDIPINVMDMNHTYYGGVGDAVFGVKRAFWSNLNTGSIFAMQGEISTPTGNVSRGFGTGTTMFGTFVSFDQLLPRNTFVQFQGGAELPVHPDIAPQAVYWHTALGKSFAADRGLGRQWTPMVEFLADRDLVNSAKTNWDILPEMQVTISHRQHIRADLGVRLPTTNTAGRNAQIMFYLLWDWGDGKLSEGW